MKKLLVATRNRGKLREIKSILSDLPYEFVSLDHVGFESDVEESGSSFIENATVKAEIVGRQTNILTLADDSGLEVDALRGRPGVKSARFVPGSDEDRLHKVLEELEGVPDEKRMAQFVAVVAIYNPIENKTYTFEGISRGRITDRPLGSNGFGYDPIFYNFDLGKTNGQATVAEKNRVSHRARALSNAKEFLLKTNSYKVTN